MVQVYRHGPCVGSTLGQCWMRFGCVVVVHNGEARQNVCCIKYKSGHTALSGKTTNSEHINIAAGTPHHDKAAGTPPFPQTHTSSPRAGTPLAGTPLAATHAFTHKILAQFFPGMRRGSCVSENAVPSFELQLTDLFSRI